MLLLTLMIKMIFISIFFSNGKYYNEKNHSWNYEAKVDYLVLALDK